MAVAVVLVGSPVLSVVVAVHDGVFEQDDAFSYVIQCAAVASLHLLPPLLTSCCVVGVSAVHVDEALHPLASQRLEEVMATSSALSSTYVHSHSQRQVTRPRW